MTRARELEGKVAVVTGASRNIGRAIALAFADAGAAVAVIGRADRAGLDETAALIKAAGGRAIVMLGDVRDEASVKSFIDGTVAEFGRLDILVNNAAIRVEEPVEKVTFASWRNVTATILDGAFLCVSAALPHLLRSDAGRIINIGGRTGHTGSRDRVHVVSAKAGLIGMTKGLAIELAPKKITVNLISPGLIATVRGASTSGPTETSDKMAPVGRRGTAEEVANMARLLAGPDGGYMTGQSIHINGGTFMP
ncbi:beta-ketoacyl-ACP reductase [Terrihabitans soli]|uniref:Beta-ketoacyl-ACP reductase n=1 Tax=Terrihabitans soli TaxID=708113 RepID=A0A6S6QW11_9HYPH|nr:SDR family NAD(P)-dependent oxidoreductase [Terrihabitans soli]BCJ91241.1 beta-ketoacyl-ACP reductase [Terrihabitans soli]